MPLPYDHTKDEMPSLEYSPANDRLRYLDQLDEYKKRRAYGLIVSMIVAFVLGFLLQLFVEELWVFAVLAIPIALVLLFLRNWWAKRAFK